MALLKKVVIWDIDGVISNSSYALEAIVGKEKPDWKKFNERLPMCTINQWAKVLLNAVSKNVIIWFITGRCNSTREVTEKWLDKYRIDYDFLDMRPEGIYGDSAGLKKKIYEDKIKGKFEVMYAIDDTPAIIEMWKNEGIHCIPIHNPLNFVD